MTDAIPPGSIKHKILEAILELGPGATIMAIRRRHPSNESICNMALDQLTAAALIEVTSEGNYALTAAAKKSMRGQSIEGAAAAIASQRRAPAEVRSEPPVPKSPTPVPPRRPVPPAALEKPQAPASSPVPPPARAKRWQDHIKVEPPSLRRPLPDPEAPPAPPSPPPITTPEPTVATITCNKCDTPKAESEYYAHNLKTCKRCILDRQKELREGTGKPAKRGKRPKVMQRAAKASVVARQSAVDELVIPASGTVHCRVHGDRFEISQEERGVMVSRDQLQAIRDWASGQLKARS